VRYLVLAVAAGEEEHALVLLLLGVQNVVAANDFSFSQSVPATISSHRNEEKWGRSYWEEGGTRVPVSAELSWRSWRRRRRFLAAVV
jgi:hypothetical protein